LPAGIDAVYLFPIPTGRRSDPWKELFFSAYRSLKKARADSAREPRARDLLAATFFVAFLLVQVAVPLFQLTQPRPARFGWHMYSTIRADALGESFHIQHAGGELSPVRRSAHVARARSEIDYRAVLPSYLCEVTTGAVAIVTERNGTPTGRYACP
jgi:hypothetical protein